MSIKCTRRNPRPYILYFTCYIKSYLLMCGCLIVSTQMFIMFTKPSVSILCIIVLLASLVYSCFPICSVIRHTFPITAVTEHQLPYKTILSVAFSMFGPANRIFQLHMLKRPTTINFKIEHSNWKFRNGPRLILKSSGLPNGL